MAAIPDWLWPLLGVAPVDEGGEVELRGRSYVLSDGSCASARCSRTRRHRPRDAFGYKWRKRDTFESAADAGAHAALAARALRRRRRRAAFWARARRAPLLAGRGLRRRASRRSRCSATCSPAIRYLGVDVSDAVDVAAARFAERGLSRRVPAGRHHASSRCRARVGRRHLLRGRPAPHRLHARRAARARAAAPPGGRFLFYVYRRKGPVREFTDDHDPRPAGGDGARARLGGDRAADEARARARRARASRSTCPRTSSCSASRPGRSTCSACSTGTSSRRTTTRDLTLDELAHINFDWFAPRNAHRQSPEEVRAWCAEAGLEIEREDVQEAGITVVAAGGRERGLHPRTRRRRSTSPTCRQ